MIINKKNIKRIHIDGGSDLKGKIRFELFTPLKPRKLSSTNFPQLLGVGSFNTKGDKLLEMCGLTKKSDFDVFYELRGAIAENLLEQILKGKGHKVLRFDKKEFDFDYFQYDEGGNKLYKYFSGLPDVVGVINDISTLYEVKSKDLSKLKEIQNNLPEDEIMQGKQLAFLYGLDSISMVWFFFSDDIMRQMHISATVNDVFDLKTSLEDFYKRIPHLTFHKDYEILRKDFAINKRELLEQMKEAYKYVDIFRQTLTLPMSDLGKETIKEIFRVEKEIENEIRGR